MVTTSQETQAVFANVASSQYSTLDVILKRSANGSNRVLNSIWESCVDCRRVYKYLLSLSVECILLGCVVANKQSRADVVSSARFGMTRFSSQRPRYHFTRLVYSVDSKQRITSATLDRKCIQFQ